MTAAHQAVRLKFPILISIRPKPIPTVIVPFISEPHRNPMTRVGPQFFYQPIVELAGPLPSEECLNLIATLDKFCAISPAAIWRVAQRYSDGIATVPGVWCGLSLSNFASALSVRAPRAMSVWPLVRTLALKFCIGFIRSRAARDVGLA